MEKASFKKNAVWMMVSAQIYVIRWCDSQKAQIKQNKAHLLSNFHDVNKKVTFRVPN